MMFTTCRFIHASSLLYIFKPQRLYGLYGIFLLFMSFNTQANILEAFTSDGCSAFPDGTYKEQTLWLQCCQAHDYAYWKGGSYQLRLEADMALQTCVLQLGKPSTSLVMLVGVRI